MKAPVDPATSARIIGDIADAVRPVEMARTAAAAERVLATASPGHGGYDTDTAAGDLTYHLCKDLGIEPARSPTCFAVGCECYGDPEREDYIGSVCATPGMTDAGEWNEFLADPIHRQQRRYAPEVVSPHLFDGGAS